MFGVTTMTKCSRTKGSRQMVHRQKVHKHSVEIEAPVSKIEAGVIRAVPPYEYIDLNDVT